MTADDAVPVDPSNAAQLEAWDGTEGEYWARHADRFDRALAAHHRPFVDALVVEPDDAVLDVGCGTGQTTRAVARIATGGSALGIDLSSAMLDYAARRAREEGLANVTFLQADAQVHAFEPAHFDVVISRMSAMFFGDHAAAFENLHGALRERGRLALLTWQPLEGNEWLRVIATAMAGGGTPRLPPPGAGPFSLSEPGRVRELLGAAGFRDVELRAVEAPMWLGADADDAYEFILGNNRWMLADLDDAGRTDALEALRATTRAHESDGGVMFDAASWIVTASA